MPTELANLRNRIRRLQLRRFAIRIATAVCLSLVMFCGSILCWYVCDRIFNLSIAARLGLDLGFVGILSLLISQKVSPIVVRESDDEMALALERAYELDNSLIAALQFESPHASNWGSSQLIAAVRQNAGNLGGALTLNEAPALLRLSQYFLALTLAIILLVSWIATWPTFAEAFWGRFCLRSDEYPTRTHLVSLTLNGQPVSLVPKDAQPHIRVPFGHAVKVELITEGELPVSGIAEISNRNKGVHTRVKLNPASKQAAQYHGDLTQLVEPVDVTFQVGDAISKPIAINVVPLPFIDIDWNIERPVYARSSFIDDSGDQGARQRSVLEGSAAHIRLTCPNKRLRTARIVVAGEIYELEPFPESESVIAWKLPAGTPFDSLNESLKYEVQVVDEDGLSPARPIHGKLRVIVDRAPSLIASAGTRKVLPTARPKIDFVATDDFGIAAIHATIEISREIGNRSTFELTEPVHAESAKPVQTHQGQFPISLTGYSLRKGDLVHVTLHAEDWRGSRPGQRTDGPSLIFSVVDLAEILHESSEDDKKSVRQLEDIMKREQSVRSEQKQP